MKGTDHEPLVADNLETVRAAIKAGAKFGAYEGVVALLADVLDTAAAGSDCYCVIGLSRNRDQVMITTTIGREKLYATGPSLVAASKAAQELL